MWSFWMDLPPWLRYGMGLVFVGISTAMLFFGRTFWPWGWVVGFVMLAFGGPSDSEKKGYRF